MISSQSNVILKIFSLKLNRIRARPFRTRLLNFLDQNLELFNIPNVRKVRHYLGANMHKIPDPRRGYYFYCVCLSKLKMSLNVLSLSNHLRRLLSIVSTHYIRVVFLVERASEQSG